MVEEDTDTSPEATPTVGNKCEVDFDIPDVILPQDLKSLKAKLTRPSGVKEEIPCTCSPDNTLGLEFTPNEPGKHVIEVTKNGRPVKGSPFVVMVEEDVSPESKPTVGHKCDVDFDIPDVNLPNDLRLLKATLTRPNGVKEPVECTCTPDNTLGLEFTPKEPGQHIIEVTKNGRPVKGSPFIVLVEEDTSPSSKPSVGHKCDVDFDIPDVNLPEDMKHLTALLTRPTGKQEPIECSCTPDNTLGLEFTPKEPGKHVIDVKKTRQTS
jgi:filamin